MAQFDQRSLVIVPRTDAGRVESIEVNVVLENCDTTFWITDVMFQGGNAITLDLGHPSEMAWTVDV